MWLPSKKEEAEKESQKEKEQMTHPSEETLVDYIENKLSDKERVEVEHYIHISTVFQFVIPKAIVKILLYNPPKIC